jgi:hypothetical protein
MIQRKYVEKYLMKMGKLAEDTAVNVMKDSINSRKLQMVIIFLIHLFFFYLLTKYFQNFNNKVSAPYPLKSPILTFFRSQVAT